jgi:hypothetical protein
MTSSIARRIAPAILIATAAFGAVAAVSVEAAGVASARPSQCADGPCHPPHAPQDNGNHGAPYNPPQGPNPPAPTQSFVCYGEGCVTIDPSWP